MNIGTMIFFFLIGRIPLVFPFKDMGNPYLAEYSCEECTGILGVDWESAVGGTITVYCGQCEQPYVVTGVP